MRHPFAPALWAASAILITVIAVALMTALSGAISLAYSAMCLLVAIRTMNRVRDERLTDADHMKMQDRLLSAMMIISISAFISGVTMMTALHAPWVAVNVVALLIPFAFYMYLIFGKTRHGDDTVFDFFTKQPANIIESGLAPIKAAGEAHRAKDHQAGA